MATFNANIAPSSAYKLTLTTTVVSQNPATLITTYLVVGTIGRNGSVYKSSSSSSSNTVVINGVTYNPTTRFDLFNNTSQEIFSQQVEVQHADNGEKTVDLSWSFNGNADGPYNPNGSISASEILPTIATASTVSATSANIGANPTITINRTNSAYTHTLKYVFWDDDVVNGTIVTKTSGLTISNWTIPTTFYPYLPNVNAWWYHIVCETYLGDTLIGTTRNYCICTMDANTNKPIVALTLVDINAVTLALTGNSSKIVNRYSNGRLTYSATPQNYATISEVKINGAVPSASPITINNITTNAFTLYAKDSRNYENFVSTGDVSNQFINYIPLTINFYAYRVAPLTGEVAIEFSGNYWDSNFGSQANTLALSWAYREKGAGSWTTGGNLVLNTHYKKSGNTFYSGTGASMSAISLGSGFTYTKIYEFIIYCQDKLVNTNTTYLVPKGRPIFWFNSSKFDVKTDFYVKGTKILWTED